MIIDLWIFTSYSVQSIIQCSIEVIFFQPGYTRIHQRCRKILFKLSVFFGDLSIFDQHHANDHSHDCKTGRHRHQGAVGSCTMLSLPQCIKGTAQNSSTKPQAFLLKTFLIDFMIRTGNVGGQRLDIRKNIAIKIPNKAQHVRE